MPDHICSRCQKVFFQKCNYQHHMNRKFPCKIKGEVKFKCEFCDKTYTRKSSLNRHLKVCSDKQMKDMEERLKEEVKEEIAKLREENKQLQNVQNVQNVQNNSNNNITQNISIVAYGKENIEKLTNNDFRTIMRRGMRSIPELVKRIHFDEKVSGKS